MINHNRYIESIAMIIWVFTSVLRGGRKVDVLRWVILVLLFIIILIALQQDSNEPSGYQGIYQEKNGPKIISYSKKWSDPKLLKQVYEELMANEHGEEMVYLEAVHLYPDNPKSVAGFYHDSYYQGASGTIKMMKNAYIEIFNMDQYDEVKEFARILAHEYGHHFTTYYYFQLENKGLDEWRDSTLLKKRQLVEHYEAGYYARKEEKYYHKWDVGEILAEDYVQLFGSPKAKWITDYSDVVERLERDIKEFSYTNGSFNLLPQENLSIPLAAEIPGYYEYWCTISGRRVKSLLEQPRTELAISQEDMILGEHPQYKITWEPVEGIKSYSLIVYPIKDNNFPEPIKTINQGEAMEAYLGSGLKHLQEGKANVILKEYEGHHAIVLLGMDGEGFIYTLQKDIIQF